MDITPVTKASEEQKAFLALKARGAPRLCHWDLSRDPSSDPPDPWKDWDRPDVMWASLDASNVVYIASAYTRREDHFCCRILFCDDDALLDSLVQRLLKAQPNSGLTPGYLITALVDRTPWPTSKLRLRACPPSAAAPSLPL